MAYGNWGATVYCDGKPKPEHCDTSVLAVLQGDYTFIFNGDVLTRQELLSKYRGAQPIDTHHAVVGDGDSGVIELLRKDYHNGYVVVDPDTRIVYLTPTREQLAEMMSRCNNAYWQRYGENGEKEQIGRNPHEDDDEGYDNRIGVWHTDILGRRWTAVSGYEYGSGFSDWADD